MKKIFLLLISIIICFCGCDKQPIYNFDKECKPTNEQYVKSIWISYFEFSEFTKDKTENEFRNLMEKAVFDIKNMGFNTITLQVRPCADAFYNSSFYPTSKYCFGAEGIYPPYDPLKIACGICQNYDIRIEAWVNPYRVSNSNDIDKLSDNNIAKKWYYDDNFKNNVYINEKGIFFNPASKMVNQLIVNGITEIVKNYDVYAIHFDDYFYPTTSLDIDSAEYDNYVQKGGKLDVFSWRRDNISNMVKNVYNAIKSVNKSTLFGISPTANLDVNYNKLYADVKLWASEDGYVDYICPQVYYGFLNETQPFISVVKDWSEFSKKPLYIGLPLYKCSSVDKYASKKDLKAINEFIDNSNIISRQIAFIEKIENIEGFYIYSYSSLFDKAKENEVKLLLETMQGNSPH